jgi:hypothetical protein
MKCLDQAVEDVGQLHFADGEAIVKTYRERLPQRWNDADGGPAIWLDCTNGKGPQYYISIATFLYEMTHGLQSKNCLFVPNASDKACFDFKDSGSLPPASAVMLSDLPRADPNQLRFLTATQKIYPYAWGLSTNYPIEIFDELNAYTITTETMTAELRAIGISAISDRNEQRRMVTLPLFMIYTGKYLGAVKNKNAKLYDEDFAEGTYNREVIDLLLGRAEKAYVAWTDELKRAKMPEYESEANLWRQYLAMKAQIASQSRVLEYRQTNQ